MPRNRRTAKKAGASFETAVQDYLRWALDDPRIVRLRLQGAKDIGDIGNVFYESQPVTLECKNTAKDSITGHLREAETEAGNNDSPYPIVVQKRRGIGTDSTEKVGEQLVFMTLETFTRIINHGQTLGALEE